MGNKQFLGAVAGAALALGISSAKAADIEAAVEPASWYVSLFGGVSWLEKVKTDYQFDGNTLNYEANTDTDIGFIVGGAAGTHLTDDLRVELEVAYSENKGDSIDFTNGGGAQTEYDGYSKFGILTFMANIWYDVPLSEELKPYIGGGAGVAIIDANVGYDDFPDFDPIFDESRVAFAFQVGAGLRWQGWENVTLDVGYRLRGIDGPNFESEVTQIPRTSDFDADWIWSHNVIAGVSFGF